MTKYRTLAVLGSGSGLPEDDIVNTWYFEDDVAGNAIEAASIGAFHVELEAFYQAIGIYMADQILSEVLTLKAYRMTDPEPRVVVDQLVTSITADAGAPLPAECALCLSYHGEFVAGVPKARRRGRLYLGPFIQGAAAASNGRVGVDSGLITTIQTEATNRLGAIGAFGGRWAQYSPTTAGPVLANLDDAFNDVVGGWVDNGWDTQRRRGHDASTRTLFGS